MKHHDNILYMRERGYRPEVISLECGRWVKEWEWWPYNHLEYAIVQIERSDIVECLDIRFVVDCRVYVNGGSNARVRELFEAAQQNDAERVIAHILDGEELVEILDTSGALTWQKS